MDLPIKVWFRSNDDVVSGDLDTLTVSMAFRFYIQRQRRTILEDVEPGNKRNVTQQKSHQPSSNHKRKSSSIKVKKHTNTIKRTPIKTPLCCIKGSQCGSCVHQINDTSANEGQNTIHLTTNREKVVDFQLYQADRKINFLQVALKLSQVRRYVLLRSHFKKGKSRRHCSNYHMQYESFRLKKK